MPRVAFVINSLANGGAERTISNITNNLCADYSCDIIVNNASESTYKVTGNIISLGIPPIKNKLKLGYQIRVFFKRLRKLEELKKRNNYDVVMSFSESASFANILSGKKHCKVVISVRVHLSSMSSQWLYRVFGFFFIKRLYNCADMIVAVSDGVRNDLVNHFGINKEIVTTIPNGCDIEYIDRLASEELDVNFKDLPLKRNLIVTMGRLEHQKGQWHLIRAMRKVKADGISFKLIILGEGSLRGYLQKVVEENGLHDDVYFVGFCDNPFSILCKADLYVLPSLFEGMGNSLIEAMACGLPCISTDHNSGAREILAPKTGYKIKTTENIEYSEYGLLIPVPDGFQRNANDELSSEERIMAQAIERMLSDSELREKYRNKSYERAKEMNLHDVANMWMNLIEELI